MKFKLLVFLIMVFSVPTFAQLSPVSQDTFPWFVNYRLPTRVVGTKAPNSIFVMDSTQTKLRAVPTDSIALLIPIDSSVVSFANDSLFTLGGDTITRSQLLGYKEYVALLTQTGTDAPVATVLYNDLGGAVVWTREDPGLYIGTLSGAFTSNTAIGSDSDYPLPIMYSFSAGTYATIHRSSGSATIVVSHKQISDGAGIDDFISLLIKVRVYN